MFQVKLHHRSWVFSGTPLILGTILLTIAASGCARGYLNRSQGPNDLPTEVPRDIRAKFEIKDSQVVAPVPPLPTSVASATPTPEVTVWPIAESQGKSGKTEKSVVAPVHPARRARAQNGFVYPDRRPAKSPIWIGEQQVFEITYFGMVGGDFTLEVLPFKTIGDRKVYHAHCKGESSKVFSLFYRLSDIAETFFDAEGFFGHRFHVVLDETKQTRDSLELYDSEKGQTFWWNRWNRVGRDYVETKEFFLIPPFSQDTFSALYYLRTLDWGPGKVAVFPVVAEGRYWDAVISYARREVLSTPMGRISTIVLKLDTKYQGILQKRGESFLWLSDDDRKIPVRLEARVRIGTVAGVLKKVQLGQPPAEE